MPARRRRYENLFIPESLGCVSPIRIVVSIEGKPRLASLHVNFRFVC